MYAHSWRQWLNRAFKSFGAAVPRKRQLPRRFRPCVEGLEERATPTASQLASLPGGLHAALSAAAGMPSAGIAFKPGYATVAEPALGATTAYWFTIALDSVPTRAVTVYFKTQDGTAVAGVDYGGVNNSRVTFAPQAHGATPTTPPSQDIMITVKGDASAISNPETFAVTLTSAYGASLPASQRNATGTISQTAPAQPVTVGIATFTQDRPTSGSTVFNVPITLANGPAPRAVTVYYRTSDGTAQAGVDYAGSSGHVTIPAGETTATIGIPVFADAAAQTSQSFTITLSNAINARLDASSSSTVVIASPGDWAMYGHDPLGSRNNTAEHTLSSANVGQLGVVWRFPTAAPVTGTPAVANGVVYAGDFAGFVYAVNADSGVLLWKVNVGHQVQASILVTRGIVIFGDINGNVWGLDALTGATKWEVHPNTGGGPQVGINGSATLIGGNIAIGFSSNEEQQHGPTGFQARGSVALLDPSDGHVIWQTYTIPQAAYDAGWRGASVWSTPTYDPESNLIYVGTGNYFQPGTGADPGVEDAVIAMDASTGAVKWVNQLIKGDVWNGNIVPGPSNPDADIGDSAKIFTMPNGEKAVGVGSKDGFYFVMDSLTGKPINGPNGLQLETGGVVGGLFASGAVDQKDGIVFANGLNWPDFLTDPKNPFTVPAGGDLYAVSLDGKTILWDFKTAAPNGSGVAIANGVVYFQSLDGTLYALDAQAPDAAHALLATFKDGGNYSGPAVSNGHVFVGTGAVIPLAPFNQYQNGIVCLGLKTGTA